MTNAEACRMELQCTDDPEVFMAVSMCRQHVEKLSDRVVKWTGATLDGKFSRSRWRNPAHAAFTFTFVEDEAEVQVGLGALAPMIYECDVDLDLKDVLDVRAREGRLPLQLSINSTDLAEGALFARLFLGGFQSGNSRRRPPLQHHNTASNTEGSLS
ncbi:hypothetical protein AB4Z46_11015 [Variovorax sp. M-6]|uniref:hypothetical protein n=1 Tax=Variovorax sp. M-6 TaxID=3233041 RepID=UPI003F94C3AF